MKILFVSLGCDKNLVDSERMIGLLADSGHTMTDAAEEAEAIVINTCCFIDDAKEESIGAVLEMAKLRREGGCRALIVVGCMAERYREEIFAEIPEVDAVLGTGSFGKIAEILARAERGERPAVFDPLTAVPRAAGRRILSTAGHYAYLKIAEGCDRRCTYCVIPKIRGPFRSVPMEDLLAEAGDLASRGVKELILVAQETTLYGTDLCGRPILHELLKKLCRIPGLAWIRVLYCYPEDIYPELLEVMACEDKICRYLDLPVQHADDVILRRMGRHTTGKQLAEIIAWIREKVPGIVLRTTLISGFPGETEEQHGQVLDFVRRQRFDRLGVFAYSQEEGTPAGAMPDQIDEDVKARRREEILLAQQEIVRERGRALDGTVQEVLIEGYLPEDGVYVGRTRADAPDVDGLFFAESARELNTGDIVAARVTGCTEYDLMGELVE